mmetsp:Transcript_46564/g.92085  ORF Transcript_46564/g.92085 Transcript_46564/m.92085 type:complete len:290 (+) Transcript_46564:306-1175(+)
MVVVVGSADARASARRDTLHNPPSPLQLPMSGRSAKCCVGGSHRLNALPQSPFTSASGISRDHHPHKQTQLGSSSGDVGEGGIYSAGGLNDHVEESILLSLTQGSAGGGSVGSRYLSRKGHPSMGHEGPAGAGAFKNSLGEHLEQREEHFPFASDEEDQPLAFFSDDDHPEELGSLEGVLGGAAQANSQIGERGAANFDAHSFVHLLDSAPPLSLFSPMPLAHSQAGWSSQVPSVTSYNLGGGQHGEATATQANGSSAGQQAPASFLSIEDELRECQMFGQTLRESSST